MPSFNNRIKQVLLLSVILLLVYLVIKELYLFLPGVLGAVTLYILSRANYFQLIYHRKWKKGWTAGLFIIYYLVLIGLPVFLAVTLNSPKINSFLADPNATINAANQVSILFRNSLGLE